MRIETLTQTLTQTVEMLSEAESLKGLFHQHRDGNPLPSQRALEEIVELSRSILFPGYYGKSTVNIKTIRYHIGVNVERLHRLLADQIMAGLCFAESSQTTENGERRTQTVENGERRTDRYDYSQGSDASLEGNHTSQLSTLSSQLETSHLEKAELLAAEAIARLPKIRKVLATDVEAAYNGDPAAESRGEIIACYPVIKALTNYRLAHELLLLGVPLIPRMLTEMAHSETGIDIHPGASVGHHFTIDHGTGVVIGATCIIGNYVKLYQGVTLGARSFPLDDQGNPIKGIPRHPIIGDDVVIYANATILGRITVGDHCVIGANVWVTRDMKPGTKKYTEVKNKQFDSIFENGTGI